MNAYPSTLKDALTLRKQINIRKKVIIGLLIFASAIGVRYLMWQDQRFDAWKTQENIAKDYRKQANFIREDGVWSLLNENARASSINFMLHPPGYPIILANVFTLFGEMDATVQWTSIISDACSAVLIFLIIVELLPFAVAAITGIFAAFSPQFASNSILLLPDVISILPLLIAFYFFVKAYQSPKMWKLLLCGAFIGVSCWIRANTLLLAPFLSIFGLFLFKERRIFHAAALTLGVMLVITPITIRNWIIYETFIPLSLGAGQTLLEGIGDYDKDKRFGMPKFDWDVTQQEAEIYSRPDYANNLISVDGIKRDRLRLKRGVKFILENPLWFAGTMIRRALWMVTPEKAPIVSTNIPVSRSPEITESIEPKLARTASELFQDSSLESSEAKVMLSSLGTALILQTDQERYGPQFLSMPLPIRTNTENVLRLRLVLREGRIRISLKSTNSKKVLVSTVVDPDPVATTSQQQLRTINIPFTSDGNTVHFQIANEAPQALNSVVEIHAVELFELGTTRNVWTLPFRYLVSSLQRFYSLPFLLSLELLGFGLLVYKRNLRTLLILFIIPLYFFSVQSALHTEYRYVLAIHHFLFALAATSLVAFATWVLRLPSLKSSIGLYMHVRKTTDVGK